MQCDPAAKTVQCNSSLHQQKYYVKIKRSHQSSIFCIGETIPRILHPVLAVYFTKDIDKTDHVHRRAIKMTKHIEFKNKNNYDAQ